ncbi:TNF receptor-associated factor family protein DDB_G0272098-like isoform X2 [Ostrinia furnacalis]|uniref:TNF receptor-associated factor family protein DDB_G0272098-like isoform X2 n=1 Tax=Ostrinia furnacalis TaxID=93504 RepID=UPI00103AB9C2|nr:TNF receptor-associated factor family protein DDB_G0272098-like isoform X2 [Ostrinia furnacalis]
MLARVGLIVCVGISLTCASPVPQKNDDPDLGVVGRTTLPSDEIYEQATELNTEDPLANSADQASNPSVAQEGGNENEAESNTEINETVNNNERSETESEPENSNNNERSESTVGTNEPPIFEDSDVKSEGKENDPGNAHEDPVRRSDEDDSENDDGHHESDDQHEITLNVIKKACFTSSLSPYLYDWEFNKPRELVAVFPIHLNGQDFTCQEIISVIKGPLQILCASNEGHFLDRSPGVVNRYIPIGNY